MDGFGVGSGPSISIMPEDKTGELYLVICFDPSSPFGQFDRYAMPFIPYPDFHLSKAHLWIFDESDGSIRIEVRVPGTRRFSDPGSKEQIEVIYGFRAKGETCTDDRCHRLFRTKKQ